jgi:hypothetical protein
MASLAEVSQPAAKLVAANCVVMLPAFGESGAAAWSGRPGLEVLQSMTRLA